MNSNPTLKEKGTPISYILSVSIPEEDWRITTLAKNRSSYISPE